MMKKTKVEENVAPRDESASAVQAACEADADAHEKETGTTVGENGVEGGDSATAPEQEDTVESLREKLVALEDSLLRAKAEFLNAQRRQEKSRQDAVRYANADLMRSLLCVLDDFERSLEAAKGVDNTEAVVEGVRLVYENFKKELTNQGLEEIDAIDQPFDPHVHEAVLQQPVADRDPNTVIEQVAKGFRLHDRVLRPAKVIVSKAVEEPAVESGDEVDQDGEGPDLDVEA